MSMIKNSAMQGKARNMRAKRLVSLILLLDFVVVAVTGIGLQLGGQGVNLSQLHMISGLVMIPLTFIHVILELRKSNRMKRAMESFRYEAKIQGA